MEQVKALVHCGQAVRGCGAADTARNKNTTVQWASFNKKMVADEQTVETWEGCVSDQEGNVGM